jgi:hypothetical protein
MCGVSAARGLVRSGFTPAPGPDWHEVGDHLWPQDLALMTMPSPVDGLEFCTGVTLSFYGGF